VKKSRQLSPAQSVVGAINTAMGRDVVMLATDKRFTIQRIPTGSLVIDRLTGGGFARGRHIELFGNESSGKSFTAYMAMVLAQERGEVCALIDGEHVFEEEWFRHLGGDPEDLVAFHPDNAEEAMKVLMLFAKNEPPVDQVKVVMIDSVASMPPMEELAKDPEEGDDRIGGQARLMSRLLRRVTTTNRDTCFLWTNQLRDKVSGYGGTTTPGGRALKFYASTRLEFIKSERVKSKRKVAKKTQLVESGVVSGHWVQVISQKEKTSRPYLDSMFFFDSERGCVDRELEIITLGLSDGLIERTGNTFRYTDSEGKLHSGLETVFKRKLRNDDELREELEWAIGENSKQLSGEAGEGENGVAEDV
jgi:recombination protein RecA